MKNKIVILICVYFLGFFGNYTFVYSENTNMNINKQFVKQKEIYSQYISFINLEDQLNKNIKSDILKSLSLKFFNKIAPKNYQYFLSIDSQLSREYNQYAISLYTLFRYLDIYLINKNPEIKVQIKNELQIVIKAIKANRDLELKYVKKSLQYKNTIYSPKDNKINISTKKLQDNILQRLNDLISSDSITSDEYNKAMNGYNYFILHLSIYLDSHSSLAKKEAIKQLNIFIPIYKKSLISQ